MLAKFGCRVGTMTDENVVAFFLSDVEWGAVWRIAAQPQDQATRALREPPNIVEYTYP